MEQLIRELNNPNNQSSPERIKEIQRQIQRHQREKTGWQLGLDLLQHDEANIRFYGALTLTIKINADWDNDELGKHEQMRNHLLEALVTHYIRLVNLPDSNFVLQKLCSTLVTLFARPDSGWTLPLRHVFTCLLDKQYVSQVQLPEMEQLLEAAKTCSDRQLKGVLMLAAAMMEDLSIHHIGTAEERDLTARALANCLDFWQIFRFCITRGTGKLLANSHYDSDRMTANQPISKSADLINMVLQASPYWEELMNHAHISLDGTQIQTIEASMTECIRAGVQFLDDDALTGSVLEFVIGLQQYAKKLLHEAIPDFPARVANSRKAKEIVNSLAQGNFSADGMLYVELLDVVMLDINTRESGYLRSGLYDEVIRSVQRLLRCEGATAVEDPVCQTILGRVNDMVEGSIDWEDDDPARTFLKSLTADACEACLQKAKFPLKQMSNDNRDWDADDRWKFEDFRYDVRDFFQSAYTLVGNGLIQSIVGRTFSNGTSPDWSTFEVGLFSLTAFSDTMSSDPDTYDGIITTVFESQPWSLLLQSVDRVPDRARQTGLRFIEENVWYLQRHPVSLALVLNFLFSSLHLQSSASAASRTIYSLCDSHRGILSEGLPQFMGSLTTLGDIGESERHRIYAAVAAIIQALPDDEAKVQPLSQLLSWTARPLAVLNGEVSNQDDLLRGCIDVMQTLASIGKGLRSPADVPVDLELSATNDTNFWISGNGMSIQRDALAIYQATLQRVQPNVDNVFVEACCDFIKSGFTEQHPSPFKFSDSIALGLINQFIDLNNPSIDYTMACASSFLASIDQGNAQTSVNTLVHSVVSNQQRVLSALRQSQQLSNSSFASSSLDFLARFMTKWGTTWFKMQDSQETAEVAMELALIIMADPDTLPRRSAAGFFTAFANFAGPNKSLDDEQNSRISGILQRFSPRILSLVIRLLGGECARSEIEIITETLKQFIQKHSTLTKAILREAVMQEQGVMSEKALKATSLEQRTRFLAQIEALRGARKTNDIVRDFWIACKGSEFGYIT
ncbi:uncharacterized protein Z518_01644 [Rhinocladiella mackenziei CBS 650.93]|uniref:Importin N-terminal domain-containing protein n=1 Tax=Rhinocladiella mackenziei CBS 650.93 TaxID=1442369 RepID=A0A0D2JM89_9EURO|nr:uncharacterized protein Z518_01644 [Rhinocladiella mackenziei CBS 650.93]KIX10560.1 hypothetical protein Z518_01644 [Rhinocladiella mackenziei CBS 650.93]